MKLKKNLSILATVILFLPLNLIIITHDNVHTLVLLFIQMLIGYAIYIYLYKDFSNTQKKIFKFAIITAGINLISLALDSYYSTIRIIEFSDITLSRVLAPLLFTLTYIVHRLLAVILCINILKPNLRKIIYLPIIFCLTIIIMISPKIFDQSTMRNTKANIIFSEEYCSNEHYVGEFKREVPWKCKLCGYTSDVSPYENVPIICFSCSLSTHRCMQCGLLMK